MVLAADFCHRLILRVLPHSYFQKRIPFAHFREGLLVGKFKWGILPVDSWQELLAFGKLRNLLFVIKSCFLLLTFQIGCMLAIESSLFVAEFWMGLHFLSYRLLFADLKTCCMLFRLDRGCLLQTLRGDASLLRRGFMLQSYIIMMMMMYCIYNHMCLDYNSL